jgi:murein DD-endopeptidase MepM/ murein hydrolase activator NlpD
MKKYATKSGSYLLVGFLLYFGWGCSGQQLQGSTEVDCAPPIQEFGGIVVGQDEMKVTPVEVCAGHRYTACLVPKSGNPDLYGSRNANPTTAAFEKKSTDNLMTVDDGSGNMVQVPRPDCITFEATTSGEYYVGVYGAAPAETNLWVSSSRLLNVPGTFEQGLSWFADACTELTTPEYGPENTPWGNAEDLDRPFYQGYPNYLHGGVDIACPADTPIRAMCDGVIVDSNDAGGDWGWHTVLECRKDDSVISIAYIHLNQASVLPIGTKVKAGDVIGTVFLLNVAGEKVHVHLTGCNRAHADCEAAGFQPERGACRRTEWWGASRYWFNMDPHSNPGLYFNFPTK